jgi:hypothetical protein
MRNQQQSESTLKNVKCYKNNRNCNVHLKNEGRSKMALWEVGEYQWEGEGIRKV